MQPKEMSFVYRSLNGTMIAQLAVEIKSRAISTALLRRMTDGLLPECAIAETPWHPLQPKAHTDPAAQGAFILDTRQRLEPFSIRIQ